VPQKETTMNNTSTTLDRASVLALLACGIEDERNPEASFLSLAIRQAAEELAVIFLATSTAGAPGSSIFMCAHRIADRLAAAGALAGRTTPIAFSVAVESIRLAADAANAGPDDGFQSFAVALGVAMDQLEALAPSSPAAADAAQ
jgi:hypothetical protein